MKKTETYGETLLELEAVLDKLVDLHEAQWGDILYSVYGHLVVHRPDAREEYITGGHPSFFYGYKND